MLLSLLDAIRKANAAMRQAKDPVRRRQEAKRLLRLLDIVTRHGRSSLHRRPVTRLRRHPLAQQRKGFPKPPHG